MHCSCNIHNEAITCEISPHTKEIYKNSFCYITVPFIQQLAYEDIYKITKFDQRKILNILDEHNDKITHHCYYLYSTLIFKSIYKQCNLLRGYTDHIAVLMDLLFIMFGDPHDEKNLLLQKFINKRNHQIILTQQEEEEIIAKTNAEIYNNISETTKRQEIESRRGHASLRKILIKAECKCKICELSNEDLLIASHSKPWHISNKHERLDFYNCLLLCPGHDALYDKGLISFNDNGEILISKLLDNETLEKLNTNSSIKIKLNPKHIKYIAYHRNHIFKP